MMTTDHDLFAQYRKTAPRLDIAFIAKQCPALLTINAEATALAATSTPTHREAARMACLWRMYGCGPTAPQYDYFELAVDLARRAARPDDE